MSAVSTAASASMSKVRHAAARIPVGQETGSGGAALLASPAPGWGGSTVVIGGSSALVAVTVRVFRRPEPSDLGADFPRCLILRYER
jgi:hypothetical protein